MKAKSLFIVIIGFLVLSLAGVSYGWQGRMAGMGDPYGLVVDESDFLIHPAKIANGKGINFYSNYRFNYTDVMDWNYTKDFLSGPFLGTLPYRTSGDEWEHNGLLGVAFPAGPGRMGFFFEYVGKRGDYDGDMNSYLPILTPPNYFNSYTMSSDLDAFALRLLYGVPMGGFKLGGEIQLAYRHEKNETFYNFDNFYSPGTRWFITNSPFEADTGSSSYNLSPFMFPYDSKYFEALLKGSLEGMIGPVKMALTARVGFIFSGDNKLDYSANKPPPFGLISMDSNLKGWNLGTDLWLRYPLSKDLSLPFLFKIDYQEKTRYGDGSGDVSLANLVYDYQNKERIFHLEVGGGADKELAKGARIAVGVYYGYLQNKISLSISERVANSWVFWTVYDHSNYPDQREHQVILRMSGEKEINPMLTLRMGLNFFYGWVKQDLNFSRTSSSGSVIESNASVDGSHWGIGAFLGGTVKFERFSLEPFIGGGYQRLNLNGDGADTSTSSFYWPSKFDEAKKDWSIGGGFSIKFN
jgi:hypothetical protein